MINPREIASSLLFNVYKGKKLDWALGSNKNHIKLDARDRSFVNLLVLTALRRNGQINQVIMDFIEKPLKKNSQVIFILRIAIAQLLFMKIPNYPVVDNAVEISKKYGLEKLVNGVLRNIIRNKEDILLKTSTEKNIPNWLKKDIVDYLGNDALTSISQQIVKEPFLDIKIKKSFFNKFNWEELLNGNKVFDEIIRVNNPSEVSNLPYFQEGYWWVQGLAATLPVIVINEIYKNSEKKKINVLDVGASPGGKSFQLLDLGFSVQSIEISSIRIRKFIKNSNRLRYKNEIIKKDFLDFKSDKKFDCILIDAPCSASGLIQKKPEMLVVTKDIKNLLIKQEEMLINATKILKTGGYIIYCVCSIISAEGEKQIKKFLNEFKNFIPIDKFDSIKQFGKIIKDFPALLITQQFFQEKGGVDGFFIACLKKKDEKYNKKN